MGFSWSHGAADAVLEISVGGGRSADVIHMSGFGKASFRGRDSVAAVRALTESGLAFVAERHLATLSTLAPWGGIHAVPVGFTFHDGILRIITSRQSQKVQNVRRDPTATISQLEGAKWIAFQGTASIHDDPDEVARAVVLYAERYRQPRVNPQRVAIHVVPHRIMGSAGLLI
jgi:PPOX class probable F420-dependent enzyme